MHICIQKRIDKRNKIGTLRVCEICIQKYNFSNCDDCDVIL